MSDQIRFSVVSRSRRFFAEGIDVPISADATALYELRRLLADAVAKYLGREHPIVLLVGVRRGPHAGTLQPRIPHSRVNAR
jgi:hypothetical protein